MERDLQEQYNGERGEGAMPCPDPSTAALEAGVFGIVPTLEDVRAFTEEHARELYAILLDLEHLQYSAWRGVDPASGRTPRGNERRQTLLVRMEREIRLLQQRYDDALGAYADGFGSEGAEALDSFVKAALTTTPPELPSLVQREMF